MTEIEKYYNKFKEDHRLTTRHGQVEFQTSLLKIREAIGGRKDVKILDLGAGTGRYSVQLCHEGYDVTAVELVPHNLEVLRAKHENVKTWKGNAMDLHFLEDDSFDVTIMFGPMYHLHTEEEKLKAMSEAVRVTKNGGTILAAYVMNEYAVIQYCFVQNNIKKCMEEKTLTEDFHSVTLPEDLYSYVRLSDIDSIMQKSKVSRIKLFAQDGPSDYMRTLLNSMDEETFKYFLDFHAATCERPELLGASSHVVDVLKVTK